MLRTIIILSFLIVQSCAFAPAGHKPVNSNATPETVNLYKNLIALGQEKVIFGHQDDLAYGVKWAYEPGRSDIKAVTGAYPGLVGWDIGKLELGSHLNLDSVPFDKMQFYIREAYHRGMVNTVSWHIYEPVTHKNSWVDEGETRTTVREILPDGQRHQEYVAMLEKVAVFFGQLKKENGTPIPVIFRPFHENNGDWFWWGARHCTPAEYKSLFRFTAKFLTEDKGLNNLLFAYSPDNKFSTREEYLQRYPGDNYVDIIGYDDYHNFSLENGAEKAGKNLEIICKLAEEKGKVAAFTETGLEGMTDSTWFTNQLLRAIQYSNVSKNIAYVMLWRNANEKHFYTSYPGHGSAENLRQFYESPFTVFCNTLPEMYE